jgi:pilus assembly protein CpaB
MHPARAVIIGLLLGVLPSVFLTAAIRVTAERANRPENVRLAPIIVTANALPTGKVVGMDDVTLRSVPETLLTGSHVKPDSASYVINQALAVPLAKGDIIPWYAFDTVPTLDKQRPSTELVEACSAEMTKRKAAAAPATVAELRAALLGAQP